MWIAYSNLLLMHDFVFRLQANLLTMSSIKRELIIDLKDNELIPVIFDVIHQLAPISSEFRAHLKTEESNDAINQSIAPPIEMATASTSTPITRPSSVRRTYRRRTAASITTVRRRYSRRPRVTNQRATTKRARVQFPCEACDKLFFCNEFLAHRKVKHPDLNVNEFKCCEKTFVTFGKLRNHLRCHGPRVPCSICNISFTRNGLQGHMKNKHTAQLKHCSICRRNVAAATYPAHRADHERIRTIKCSKPGCDKVFKSKSSLASHQRSHLPKEPCRHCQKLFGYFGRGKHEQECAKRRRIEPLILSNSVSIVCVHED